MQPLDAPNSTPLADLALDFQQCLIESSKWDHDKNSEAELLNQRGAALGLILGIRPGMLLEAPVKNLESIQKFIAKNHLNISIFKTPHIDESDESDGSEILLFNPQLIKARILREPAFAQSLGWSEEITVREWLENAFPNNDTVLYGILGFFLGYPQSAIKSFLKNCEKETPPLNLKPDMSREELNQRIYEHQAKNNYLCIEIPGPYGGNIMYFMTYKDKMEAPDVLELIELAQTKLRQVFGDTENKM